MKFIRIFLPAMAVVLLLLSLLSRDKPKCSPFAGKMMALEFAGSQNEVDALWENPQQLQKLKNQLSGDTRFFIPLYWLFFVSLNAFMIGNWVVTEPHVLLRGIKAITHLAPAGRRTIVRVMALLVPVVISIAAIADFQENTIASRMLDHSGGTDRVYVAAVIKWSAIAVASFALGLGFLEFRRKTWSLVAAAAYIVTGIAMAVALIHYWPWMEPATGLLLASMAATGPAIYGDRVGFKNSNDDD